MESSTNNYLNSLHVLLKKLSSEIDKKPPHGNFPYMLNPINSKHFISVIEGVDKYVLSTERSFNTIATPSTEDISKSTTNYLSLFHLVIDGYAVSSLAVIGLVLNIIGVCILSTGQRREKIINLLVASLLAFDAIYLLSKMLKSLALWLISIPRAYFKAYMIIVVYVLRYSMIASILMLVTISRARLCAIKKPLQHNPLSWQGRRNYCFRYWIRVIISSMVLTIPFYYEIGYEQWETDDPNLAFTATNSRLHPVFLLLYIGFLNLGILGLIPLVYLANLNHHIRRELKKEKEQDERLGSRRSDSSNNEESNEDRNTRGLLGVIVSFIVFHSFRVMIAIGEIDLLLFYNNTTDFQNGSSVPTWLAICLSINDLLLVINASINAVIYLKPNLTELLDTFIPTRRERYNKTRFTEFTEMYQKRNQRKILEKRKSVDLSIISMDNETTHFAEMQSISNESRKDEIEMMMFENKEGILIPEIRFSFTGPCRQRSIRSLFDEPTFDALDGEFDTVQNASNRRRSMLEGIMNV